MGLLVFIILIAVWGFAIGGLARWAVPGPDPMSVWMTMALGIGGSFFGGLIARFLIGTYGGLLFSFLGAVLLLIAYRRWVQHRPLTGPEAQRPPH
jgi:uncharacterized membrane protein YeaQ/YmgE (transglycosylase-associated protein family)